VMLSLVFVAFGLHFLQLHGSLIGRRNKKSPQKRAKFVNLMIFSSGGV